MNRPVPSFLHREDGRSGCQLRTYEHGLGRRQDMVLRNQDSAFQKISVEIYAPAARLFSGEVGCRKRRHVEAVRKTRLGIQHCHVDFPPHEASGNDDTTKSGARQNFASLILNSLPRCIVFHIGTAVHIRANTRNNQPPVWHNSHIQFAGCYATPGDKAATEHKPPAPSVAAHFSAEAF